VDEGIEAGLCSGPDWTKLSVFLKAYSFWFYDRAFVWDAAFSN
jgi:hypothetical protein